MPPWTTSVCVGGSTVIDVSVCEPEVTNPPPPAPPAPPLAPPAPVAPFPPQPKGIAIAAAPPSASHSPRDNQSLIEAPSSPRGVPLGPLREMDATEQPRRRGTQTVGRRSLSALLDRAPGVVVAERDEHGPVLRL